MASNASFTVATNVTMIYTKWAESSHPQENPSFIARFHLVKKTAATLPILIVLKATFLKRHNNQGRREMQLN